MATIRARPRADGSIGYSAIVRVFKKKKLIHQEQETFSRRSAAEKWAKEREVALEDPAALLRAKASGSLTLGELIQWYLDTFRSVSRWGRTKQSQLEALKNHATGQADVLLLDSSVLVDHVRARRGSGVAPSTAGNDLTWLGVVLRAAKSVKKLPVRPEIVAEARDACRELRLIGKSRKRVRTPTYDELVALDGYFGTSAIPPKPGRSWICSRKSTAKTGYSHAIRDPSAADSLVPARCSASTTCTFMTCGMKVRRGCLRAAYRFPRSRHIPCTTAGQC